VYHALNRAVARLPLFQKERDYQAFEQVMGEALQMHPTRVLAYCLPTNGAAVGIASDATAARSPAQKRGQ
jgi:hypothetical protein